MTINTEAGEVRVTLVIKDRVIIGVEEAEVTNGFGKVGELSDAEKQRWARSSYGCRPIETIYETQQTQSPTECFIMIGKFKIKVPCS